MSEMKGRFGLDAEWLYWGFPRSWGGGAGSPNPKLGTRSVLSAKTRKLLSIGAGAWYTPRYRKYRKSFLPDRGIPSLLCM